MEAPECSKRLDELTREDLLTKCRHLLSIAQKAKQSKQTLLEEKEELRAQLRARLRKLAGTARTLRSEKDHLLSITKAHLSQVSEWRERLRSAEGEIVRCFEATRAENDRLRTENDRLRTHDSTVGAEVLGEMQSMNEALKERGENVSRLERLLKKKEEEETKSTEEIGVLRLRLASKEREHLEVVEGFARKLALRENSEAKLTRELEDLNSKLASKEQDSIELHESMKILRQKLVAREESEAKSTQELENLRLQLASKELDSVKLKESLEVIQDLRQQLNSKEEVENTRRDDASKKLEESVRDLRQKLASREESETELTREVESLRLQLALKEQESTQTIQDLREKLTLKEGEECKFTQELENLRLQLASEEQESARTIQDLRQKLTLKEEEESKFTQELENLRLQLASKEEKESNLTRELEDLRLKLASKDKQIEELTDELNSANNDSMSTSTISRSDELSRLRDLEGSWEERYGKLRTLAVKLKGKVRELGTENDSLRKTKDEIINGLRKEIEALSEEKSSTEDWKKRIGAKVQTLRKELEANAALRKEAESRIDELSEELRAKEQALEQLAAECKRRSVLSLEMQDYERGSKETSRRLQQQQETIDDLSKQLETQKIAAERLVEEEEKVHVLRSEIESCKSIITRLEEELRDRESRASAQTRLLESERLESERLALELAEARREADSVRVQLAQLRQALREARDASALRGDELRAVAAEYEAYRVRARSVLRRSNGRDVGTEERMAEEAAALGAVNAQLEARLEEARETIESLEAKVAALESETESRSSQIREMAEEIDDLKAQYGHLAANHERTVAENSETIRSLKVHAETLSQCYRQQLAEQESRHSRELAELRGRLDRPQPIETPQPSPTMPREEGEGSENVDSLGQARPVPLERLLGADASGPFDSEELSKRLADEESKVVHLTALLSDTEKDLVKHVQMNELLKEEIRRRQRSLEREEHAENLEYLKNVVFKFVTLAGGDERSRLVPVLNTILKLSPDETRRLAAVARGEGAAKAWTSYLPAWSAK